jgi:DNA-binding transcriptional ArsR family regulator
MPRGRSPVTEHGAASPTNGTAVAVLQLSLYHCPMASDMLTVIRPDADQIDALHRVGRALSDPTRCRIMLCLLEGPHYPTDLADHLALTKANVSNHLSCLRGCGLVEATQEGRRQRYELADERLAHALCDLLGLSTAIGSRVCAESGGVGDE